MGLWEEELSGDSPGGASIRCTSCACGRGLVPVSGAGGVPCSSSTRDADCGSSGCVDDAPCRAGAQHAVLDRTPPATRSICLTFRSL